MEKRRETLATSIDVKRKKRPYHLLHPQALEALVDVLAYGANKHGSEDNWKKLPDAKILYQDALQRHLAEIRKGNARDEESGMLHAAHVLCNAFFLLILELDGSV